MSEILPTITDEQSRQLLVELLKDDRSKFPDRRPIRNYTMAVLMLDVGLRVNEIARLWQSDLLFNGPPAFSLRISKTIAKYNHEREIPLTNRAREAISAIEIAVWNFHNPCPESFAFFATDPKTHLTSRQIQRIIKSASLRALGYEIHPHVLRHTFATRLMRTTPIRVVQELLGHKNLSSTQIYTHPNTTDLKTAIDSLNGGAN